MFFLGFVVYTTQTKLFRNPAFVHFYFNAKQQIFHSAGCEIKFYAEEFYECDMCNK